MKVQAVNQTYFCKKLNKTKKILEVPEVEVVNQIIFLFNGLT
jgi:hypothetical protein